MSSELEDPRLKWLFGRRSIRKYRPGEVSDAQVETLLKAAMAAPSAVARDPWRFIVVRNPDTLAELAGHLSNGDMVREAGLAIVVAGDLEAAHDQQLSYLLQDCSAAIENLLLAAHALGLGACWLGVHPREARITALSKMFALPGHVLPVSVVAVGHPVRPKEPRTRYNPEYVHRERWGRTG
jgi:nitroreductase